MTGDITAADPEIRSPRALFAQRFAELYEAAGNPTLRRVAAAAETRMRAAQGNRLTGASAQRISDWKAGRNVPARFESLLPVVLTLIEWARKSGQPLPRVLAEPREWQRLWQAATTWTPEDEDESACPYLGLTSYRSEDRDLFFGRTRATAELTTLVRAATGIVALVGASGAGKSSLLAAGLAPALADWEIISLTPGPNPLATLLHAATPAEESADPAGPPADGTTDEQTAHDELCRGNLAPHPERPRRIVVLDQFEELFTICENEGVNVEDFLNILDGCATRTVDPISVVIAVRADFYAHCLNHPVLQEALEHRSFLLGPMRMDELAQAVTGPARAAGLELEPGLEELVITELCGVGDHQHPRSYDPGALPLLSHVMAATWQQREGRKLTVHGYRKAGGVVGSVAETAEHAWNELAEPQQRAAKDILLGLVAVGRDSRDTRRPAERSDLLRRNADLDAASAAMELLSRTRLVTLDADAVTLTHEIVLSAWPRLRTWINEDRVGYLIRQRLEVDAAEWAAYDRDSSRLYRGTLLHQALDHVEPPPVGDLAREFLTASTASRDSIRRRSTRTKVVLAALGVVLLVLGFAAYTQTQLAEQQRDDKNFAAVLAEADRQLALDPSLAAQLYLVARQIRPDDADVRTRLLRTQNLPLVTAGTEGGDAIRRVRYLPGGAVLAALTDNTLRLWDSTDPRDLRPLGNPISEASEVSFSPDGKFMITTTRTGDPRLWDTSTPTAPRELAALPKNIGGQAIRAEFVGDGRTLATLTASHIVLWDVSNPVAPVPGSAVPLGRSATESGMQLLRYNPARRLLAIISYEGSGEVQLWDVSRPATAALVGQFRPVTLSISDLAFDPDGTTVAIGGYDAVAETSGHQTTVRLWNISDPARPQPFGASLNTDDDTVNALTFSPDGHTLATAGEEGTVLWNVTALAAPVRYVSRLTSNTIICRYREVSTPCSDGPSDIDFAPDGRTLVTTGAAGRIQTWSLPPSWLDKHGGLVEPPVFDASGERMVTYSSDGRFQIWELRNQQGPKRIGELRLPARGYGADLSPDGRTLLLASAFPNVGYIVDLSDPTRVGAPVEWRLPAPFYDVAISPDWRTLAASDGESIQLWDLADRNRPVAIGKGIPGGSGASSITFTPDGKTLLLQHPPVSSNGDFIIARWDISDPRQPKYLDDLARQPAALSNFARFTADFRLMVTTDSETLQVWNISDLGNPVAIGDPFVAHPLSTRSIDFTADARTMITSDYKGSVQLWDFTDPAHPRRIGGSLVESDQAWIASLHPNGHYAFGTAEDGALRAWDLDVQHAIDRICDVTETMWTEELWTRYLPQLSYRPPCD